MAGLFLRARCQLMAEPRSSTVVIERLLTRKPILAREA